MEKPPKLSEYNGKGDPNKHVQLINERLNYFNADKASKWKNFVLNLFESYKLWSNAFPNLSIKSWVNLSERLSAHFAAQKRKPLIVAALS